MKRSASISHSDIHATNLEHKKYYLEIDSIVDTALAAESSKILIRAYYYAKLNAENPARPKTWTQYLNNFSTPAKLTRALSESTMRELKDVLCTRFGLDFELREETKAAIDKDETQKLAERIKEMRPFSKRDVLADNDAFMILRIESERKKEKYSGNPYGYKTWYLTQDSISNMAFAYCFRSRKDSKFVMRPEFLLNYIAYNPTDDAVRQSLKTIFPSVMGVRLGSRLSPSTLTKVLDSIEKAHQVDPARAVSIIAAHADALKSNKMRDFALKYGAAN